MTEFAERPDPMGTRFAETDTDTLIAEALASDDDEFVERLRAIHRRGTLEIFLKAVMLCREEYPRRRALGFDILAQLGNGSGRPFAKTTAPVLLEVLAEEENELVLSSALNCLGQLWNHTDVSVLEPALEHISRLAGHESSAIRYTVAVCLGTMSTAGDDRMLAYRTNELATLASDDERDIRDMAVFHLSLIAEHEGYRGLKLIDTLRRAARDEDIEVRQQAIAGLAHAGAIGAVDLVRSELEAAAESDAYYLSIVEAAAALADPSLLPALRTLRADESLPDHFHARFDAAIAACSKTAAPLEASPIAS